MQRACSSGWAAALWTWPLATESESSSGTIVLFDIDGTLIRVGGAGVKAMALAFEQLFGVADALGSIDMSGRSDSWIVGRAFALHGVSDGRGPTRGAAGCVHLDSAWGPGAGGGPRAAGCAGTVARAGGAGRGPGPGHGELPALGGSSSCSTSVCTAFSTTGASARTRRSDRSCWRRAWRACGRGRRRRKWWWSATRHTTCVRLARSGRGRWLSRPGSPRSRSCRRPHPTLRCGICPTWRELWLLWVIRPGSGGVGSAVVVGAGSRVRGREGDAAGGVETASAAAGGPGVGARLPLAAGPARREERLRSRAGCADGVGIGLGAGAVVGELWGGGVGLALMPAGLVATAGVLAWGAALRFLRPIGFDFRWGPISGVEGRRVQWRYRRPSWGRRRPAT